LLKHEKDLLAESHSILNRWENYFSQLLNVYRASDIRQIAEPLVLDPSPLRLKIAIAKLIKYKSPGSSQILAEMIQEGGETFQPEIRKLTNSV
jgi:hypothetical protein